MRFVTPTRRRWPLNNYITRCTGSSISWWQDAVEKASLLGSGFLYRILSLTDLNFNCKCSIGGLRAQSARSWLSLPHHVDVFDVFGHRKTAGLHFVDGGMGVKLKGEFLPWCRFSFNCISFFFSHSHHLIFIVNKSLILNKTIHSIRGF